MEFMITATASMLAVYLNPGRLSYAIMAAWIASLVAAISLHRPYLPAAYAVIDLGVAITALTVWTNCLNQRARVVGLISMVLICAHFGYATSWGRGNWKLYAAILNAGFVLQCFTIAGGWHGLAVLLDRFRDSGHRLRSGGKYRG